jgi:hypothetical protein
MFMPFGLLAPRFLPACLCLLVYLLPYFGYPVYALWFRHKQDDQNMGASKPKGLTMMAKIWKQVNQRA